MAIITLTKVLSLTNNFVLSNDTNVTIVSPYLIGIANVEVKIWAYRDSNSDLSLSSDALTACPFQAGTLISCRAMYLQKFINFCKILFKFS